MPLVKREDMLFDRAKVGQEYKTVSGAIVSHTGFSDATPHGEYLECYLVEDPKRVDMYAFNHLTRRVKRDKRASHSHS